METCEHEQHRLPTADSNNIRCRTAALTARKPLCWSVSPAVWSLKKGQWFSLPENFTRNLVI